MGLPEKSDEEGDEGEKTGRRRIGRIVILKPGTRNRKTAERIGEIGALLATFTPLINGMCATAPSVGHSRFPARFSLSMIAREWISFIESEKKARTPEPNRFYPHPTDATSRRIPTPQESEKANAVICIIEI